MKIGNRKRLTGAALIFSLLLTGCQKGDNSIEDKGSESRTLVETEKLAQNIHEKYNNPKHFSPGGYLGGHPLGHEGLAKPLMVKEIPNNLPF